jgi:hypothetical protein
MNQIYRGKNLPLKYFERERIFPKSIFFNFSKNGIKKDIKDFFDGGITPITCRNYATESVCLKTKLGSL